MNTDDIKTELRKRYGELIERHERLKERAREGVDEHSPHTEAEIKAEADGVLKGIQKIEEVLNMMEEDDSDE